MKRVFEALYRGRAFVMIAGAMVIVASASLAGITNDPVSLTMRVACSFVGMAAIVGGLVLGAVGSRFLPERSPVTVAPPMQGRWRALNSPASAVPSHATRAYGQSHAIDLVFEPEDPPRPAFGDDFRRPADAYPGFGQPVLSMVDGTVVHASGWRRDHTAYASMAGIFVMYALSLFRALCGPGAMCGNHVIIRSDDGFFTMTAHLKRKSLTVKRGDRVARGDTIGLCGNTGNSSEPHIHAQLMDRRSLWTAQGVPITFSGIQLGSASEPSDGLPENQQLVTVA